MKLNEFVGKSMKGTDFFIHEGFGKNVAPIVVNLYHTLLHFDGVLSKEVDFYMVRKDGNIDVWLKD